jgi:hypothetical protein
MSNIDEQADPSESYVAAARSFHGMELKPYSLGNKMLLAMITRDGDPNSFFLFAVLYVLTQPRSVVQRAAANKDQVREDVLAWLDGLSLSTDEQGKAQDLAIEILQEANKEKVDPIATAAAGNE